jgi:hypothetical protein
MNHTIETTPEIDRALEAKAKRRGVPVDELLRGVVEEYAQAPGVPGDAFDAELDALLLSQPNARAAAGLGPLQDDAVEAACNQSGGFLAMLADSAPRIAAGTLRPLTSDDISQAIADARP